MLNTNKMGSYFQQLLHYMWCDLSNNEWNAFAATFIAFIILVWKILISIFICIFRHNVRHANLYMLVLNRIPSRYQGQGLIFPYCEAYNIWTWKDIFLPHINLVILTTIHAHSLVQISAWYHQIKSLLLPPA